MILACDHAGNEPDKLFRVTVVREVFRSNKWVEDRSIFIHDTEEAADAEVTQAFNSGAIRITVGVFAAAGKVTVRKNERDASHGEANLRNFAEHDG